MWTPDYFVRYIQLPPSIEGVTVPNDDGTFDIYINQCLSKERQQDSLAHELEHLRSEHFYRDDCELATLEAAADHLAPTPAPAVLQIVTSATEPAMKVIPCFGSPTAYLEPLKASGEFQRMIDAAHAQGVKLYGID